MDSKAQDSKFNINVKNATLREVLDKIEKESDYYFYYKTDESTLDYRVSGQFEDESILELLDSVLAGTNLTYRIVDNYIALVPKQASGTSASGQEVEKKVTGKVIDAQGEPIPGVNIYEKGTSNGVITGIDGDYNIKVSNVERVLVFSFIGFDTQEIQVNGRNEINITLMEEITGLDEVVVVGYGTQKKVNLTGAVESVQGDVIAKKAAPNIGQALQGVVPNLNVSVANGDPNTQPSFNIRGGTSFSYNSSDKKWQMNNGSPLVLVDGVKMNLNRINPEDVQSISVIKDAAAAAIYGSEGTYGVILVTTKGGQKDTKPTVSYSSMYQLSSPINTPDLMNSYQYQKAQHEAIYLSGETPSAIADRKLAAVKAYYENPDTAPYYIMEDEGDLNSSIIWVGNTDPYEEIIGDYAPLQKHNISVRGGGKYSTYYASVGYQGQEGIYKVNADKHKRYNAVINLSSDITDWLKTDFRLNYSQIQYDAPIGISGIWGRLSTEAERMIMMPVRLPENSPAGDMFTDNKISFFHQDGNRTDTKTEDMVLFGGATVKLAKWLDIKGDLSYKSYNYYKKDVRPEHERIDLEWYNPVVTHSTPGYVSKFYTRRENIITNIYANFDKTFFTDHNVNGVFGYNQELFKYSNFWARGEHMISEEVPVIGKTTGDEKYANDGESHWAKRGAFVRLSYSYKGKYLAEINGRYDGTSYFDEGYRFNWFPSYSVGWRVSEEIFMDWSDDFLDNLKLRASYGSLGNAQGFGSFYPFYPSYGSRAEVNYIFDGNRPMAITQPGMVDAQLTWETASTLDFGFDMMVWNKLSATYDWYERKTTDILGRASNLPGVLGASEPKTNSGTMKTVGWELSINWNDRLDNGLQYGLGFMMSDYKSEIIEFANNEELKINTLYKGMKMGEIWGYETEGIFQTQEEIDAYLETIDYSRVNSDVRPGDIKYANLNSDDEVSSGLGVLEDTGDKRIIGNTTPRYQFGITANAEWKGFDFNMHWQGVGKRDVWISNVDYWGLIGGGTGTMYTYNKSWTPERPDAYFPAYRSSGANRAIQTRYLQNGAFMRLKTLTLGYTIPKLLIQKGKVDNVRVYFTGTNLLTFDDLPDMVDPEMLSQRYPLMKSYTLGVQVSF
ncbi:MAG: TonB-dependent receptor [Marinilabiliaceae bacterium]|nr:TonB-dependent receptor [Marinilabiliaceae bacterium]